MLVMDNADIFIGAMRAFMDFAPVIVTLVIYAGLLSSWFWTRIYTYTTDILGPTLFGHKVYVNK